jgi:hypothetical protein
MPNEPLTVRLPFHICFTALHLEVHTMNSYTSFSPLVEAFSATRPWYLKKNNLLYPPNILMGYLEMPQNRVLTLCSLGVLQMHFMLSIQLLCVLIIITVVGLINESQELR